MAKDFKKILRLAKITILEQIYPDLSIDDKTLVSAKIKELDIDEHTWSTRLEKQMAKKGIMAKEMAILLNVTESTMSRTINGKTDPDFRLRSLIKKMERNEL